MAYRSHGEFVKKIAFLEKIQKYEVVDTQLLAAYLGMGYSAVARRLDRYKKAGLLDQPVAGDKGKYCLTDKGIDTLDYLKKVKKASLQS